MKPDAGKWTRTPPGGDVTYVYDRDALKDFIEHTQRLADEAIQMHAAPPAASTVPRVAQRFVMPDGSVSWLVAGSEKLWPEAQLRKKVVWWSKPLNLPRISFVLAQDIKNATDATGEEARAP